MKELLERKKGFHRSILIVDDEFIEREMLGAMLCDLYEIMYAENGVAALDILRQRKIIPSVVILDLHMPELDGFGLLKIIRSDRVLRRIPVIVLTSEKGSEVECLKMGAADFITKPYEAPEIIRARVEHSVELAEDSIIIHETQRDELTELFNKEFFYEYGKRLDEQNQILMDAVVIDINRFHIVNELYGKDYGDLVLKRIGGSIHELVRNTGGLACRSGSNSFAVYIPHDSGLNEHLTQYIDSLRDRIGDKNISVRIGIYLDDGSGFDMERRFDCASLACQRLRSSYSTCYAFYDAELHGKELYAERLIKDMDRALAQREFKVYYQPKYDIRGEKPVLASAEALVRWQHPELGMVSPGQFISVFENNGLIHKLDRYVWNEAAAQIRRWKDEFGVTVPVSVNVSRVDIFDPMLGDTLIGILENNGITSDDLQLEITESAYTDNAAQIIETVRALRKMGFRIEMDDFGCGYSSLNMLTSMPTDALKLDMAFIRDICKDTKAARLVGIIIEIARLLEVPVIAEGVETKEQMELLKELDCDIIQGYYFSRPVPPDDFAGFLTDSKEGAYAYD